MASSYKPKLLPLLTGITIVMQSSFTPNVFREHSDIIGIVHFAAFKSVPESIEEPLLYYHNNILSLINLLNCCEKFSIENFVFSSSCSVYGDLTLSPVSENTPIGSVACPYAQTKQIGG